MAGRDKSFRDADLAALVRGVVRHSAGSSHIARKNVFPAIGRGALAWSHGQNDRDEDEVGAGSRVERARYRALIADDVEWRRPTVATARKVCVLLGVNPNVFQAPRASDDATAAQAFVVALDYLIRVGDQGRDGAQLLWNGLFDALARHWSMSYRDAQERGARVSYYMAPRTIRMAWRELRWAGLDVEAIWTALVGVPGLRRRSTVPPAGRLGELYTIGRVSGRGHARGRKVGLIEGALLDDVRYTILQDPQYACPDRRRLLLADDDAPPLPPRQAVCEEQPYETVTLGERSLRILSLLERARVRFYVERFRQDFEERPELAAWRSVYEQTAGLVPERMVLGGAPFVEIRSRFFRAVNRRFHAADFWPEHVPDEYRIRWFGFEPRLLDENAGPHLIGDILEAVFVGDEMAPAYADPDISSSQTQVLAVFLGLLDLEELARSPTLKFKCYLARRLWAVHEGDEVLAPGYDGPDDARLVAFIKEHWMRWNYGGKFGEIARALAKEPDAYGPGWNADVFRAGGVNQAERHWHRFRAALPNWEREVSKFLDVCQEIGRDADWEHGIALEDPLDGAEIQWNPIRRATDRVATGKRWVEVLRPGIAWRRRDKGGGRDIRRFLWRPRHVNTQKLANRVAPCLVHTLDAYFNALVLEELHWEGEQNVVAVHDSWFVPAVHMYVDRPGGCTGKELVERAIHSAGRAWLEGIGGVYGWLADATLGTRHRRFAREIRQRWRWRVAQQRWPRFSAV